MFGIHNLTLFIVSGLLLNITPGPDILLIAARSTAHGWRAGSAAALGISAGVFVHVFAAALGLSALLAASATAFAVVKYLGAAYLIYVGFGLIWQRAQAKARVDNDKSATLANVPAAAAAIAPSFRRIFVQGFFTNALNPKVALFFLAFVPQFIAPESSDKALAFIVLGCLFNFNNLLWCHVVAIASARASRHVQLGRRASVWLQRLVGAIFIGFGLRLILARA